MKNIDRIYVETTDGRYFTLSVKDEDLFGINYEERNADFTTRLISIKDLFEILSFDGDRLKKVADETMQKHLDELTAIIKKNESELQTKNIEVTKLRTQISALKEAFKNS